MFQHNLGTKELVDALILCREALLNLPVQQIPRFRQFSNTLIMGQYVMDLVDAVEGRASVASGGRLSGAEGGGHGASEHSQCNDSDCCRICVQTINQ